MLDRKLYQIIVQTLGEHFFSAYGDNFSNKLITQKTLYLLTQRENSRIKLPYKWTFYLYGPYSSEIAHMILYMIDYRVNLRNSKNELNEVDFQEIDQLKVFLQCIESRTLQTPQTPIILQKETLYELLATILYLQKELGDNPTQIFKILAKLKPKIFDRLNFDQFSQLHNAITQIRSGISLS